MVYVSQVGGAVPAHVLMCHPKIGVKLAQHIWMTTLDDNKLPLHSTLLLAKV